MLSPQGEIIVLKGQHSLHHSLSIILPLTACVGVAVTLTMLGRFNPFKPNDALTVEARLFPLMVHLPLYGQIEAATRNAIPDELIIAVEAKPARWSASEASTTGFQQIYLKIVTPVFVDLFETWAPWVRDTHGQDPRAWPSTFNFARVVRNAISHGGKIHFSSTSSPPVQWHHLTYGPADQGRAVVGGDFQFGDFLLLMVDMSLELDRLGCPVA